MAVYLIGFAISVALIALSEKRQFKVFFLSSAVALLIPCLIAALRADSIGTDVEVYIKPLMNEALKADNIKEYYSSYWNYSWSDRYVVDFEYGFSFMVYLLTKLTRSQPVVLFAIAALIIVPVYVALARNRKNSPVWLGMLVFYLLFYNATLNMLRQWIAMAFLLLAFQFLKEKKYWPTVLLSASALLFHYSSIIAVPIYAVYWFLQWSNRYTLQESNLKITGGVIALILISTVSLMVILNLDVVLKLMSAIGFDRFSNYLEGNSMTLLVNQIIIRLPLLLLFVIYWKQLCRYTQAASFYFVMLVLDLIAAQLISIDTYAFRIGQYFLLYAIIAIPELYTSLKKPLTRNLTTVFIIAYLLAYWFYNYVIQLRHETYPYQFCFLTESVFFPFINL